MFKDGWVRSQSCHGKLIDIALECSVIQQVTRNVVEPQALPEIMQFLCRLHRSSCSGLSRRALSLAQATHSTIMLPSQLIAPRAEGPPPLAFSIKPERANVIYWTLVSINTLVLVSDDRTPAHTDQ